VVGDDVLVLLPVDELVVVTDKLVAVVFESVPLLLLLSDGNAPIVTDEVGDWEIDLEREMVELGVVLEVEVADDVSLPVGDIEAVALRLIVDDDVIVGLLVELNETDGVLLAEPPIDKEPVAVAEIVVERLFVVDPLSLPVGVCDGVCDEVLVPLLVGEPVPLTDELIVEVGESVPEGVDDGVPDFDGVADVLLEQVMTSEVVGDLDSVNILETEAVGVGVVVTEGVTDFEGVCASVPETDNDVLAVFDRHVELK
jgi:hypothetical protein